MYNCDVNVESEHSKITNLLNGVVELVIPQLVKKIPHFMEHEGSLPWIPGVWDVT